MDLSATRLTRALGRRLRSPAVRLGLLPYRPAGTLASEADYYSDGAYEYFGDLDELPRYSVIAGYLRWLGGEPAILDVGCGYGLLRQRIEGIPFARYVGVDPLAPAIERASELRDERTSFVEADLVAAVGRPPIERAGFDVCTAIDVLYVSDDPPAVLDAVREALRPGGHLLACNLRHSGDAGLARLIDERFTAVDAVEVRNLTSPNRRVRRWRMTLHRREPD